MLTLKQLNSSYLKLRKNVKTSFKNFIIIVIYFLFQRLGIYTLKLIVSMLLRKILK